MNAQTNDVFACHVTFDKVAFGIVLKKFYDRNAPCWHTLTFKIWKTDYIYRITKNENTPPKTSHAENAP